MYSKLYLLREFARRSLQGSEHKDYRVSIFLMAQGQRDREWPALGLLSAPRQEFSRKWSIPRGRVQKGETLTDAARRIALEETGYDVGHALSPIFRQKAGVQNFQSISFIAFCPQQFDATLGSKHIAHKWFPSLDALREGRTNSDDKKPAGSSTLILGPLNVIDTYGAIREAKEQYTTQQLAKKPKPRRLSITSDLVPS